MSPAELEKYFANPRFVTWASKVQTAARNLFVLGKHLKPDLGQPVESLLCRDVGIHVWRGINLNGYRYCKAI